MSIKKTLIMGMIGLTALVSACQKTQSLGVNGYFCKRFYFNYNEGDEYVITAIKNEERASLYVDNRDEENVEKLRYQNMDRSEALRLIEMCQSAFENQGE